ncbi:MAG TPA: DUF115 domain-containing protein, partial [bacterium]|nr:DUF115 domain-containing protein [bacterium]
MKTDFKTDLSLLSENIKKKIEEYLPDENVKLVKTKNNEYSIIKNNLRLYSIYKPTEEVNKFIKTINIEENNIVILLGFGLGYHFQKIFNSFKFKKIFIIEYNYDVLYFAFQLFDYSTFLRKENVYFVDTTNDTSFLDFLADNISLDELDKIKIIKIDNIIKSEREKFINALVLITKLYNFKIINFGTIVKFSREWQNNTLRNLLNLNNTNNISNFKNIFNNKPILIVCAGPSLENKIEYIKKLKSHIIIAAVDTATKVLLDNGIKPDIIAIVDSQAINYSLIKDLDLSDIYLLINLIVPPEIYQKHSPKKIIIYNSNTPVLDWFEKNFNIKIGYLKSGGSVSTILFSFAIFTGCNPIIFVGQDLSFPEMKIYSQGTKKEELYLSALNKFITYETFIFNNYLYNENIITEKDIY